MAQATMWRCHARANLAMVALTSRMQHEFNYSDEQLAKRKLRRLSLDPHNIEMKWIIDFCAQSLREICRLLGIEDEHPPLFFTEEQQPTTKKGAKKAAKKRSPRAGSSR